MKDFVSQISGLAPNPSMCPDLDLTTRILGFLITFVIGFIMMIGSVAQILSLVLGGQAWFAMWFTAGNIVCLSSTFFLMGPKKQCENMLNPVRATISFILGGSMVSTVILAIVGISKLLTIISIGVQFFCLTWYVLSYIPHGRTYCGKCLKSMILGGTDDTYDV